MTCSTKGHRRVPVLLGCNTQRKGFLFQSFPATCYTDSRRTVAKEEAGQQAFLWLLLGEQLFFIGMIGEYVLSINQNVRAYSMYP